MWLKFFQLIVGYGAGNVTLKSSFIFLKLYYRQLLLRSFWTNLSYKLGFESQSRAVAGPMVARYMYRLYMHEVA